MSVLRAGVAAVGGYLLGTIPTADLVSTLARGPDLRSTGSGNPGAANAASILGPRAGLVVLVGDVAKGTLAGRIGSRLGGPTLAQVAATAAVVGHCHPLWSGFRGGKGVATSVGQVLATFPVYFPIDAAVAVATAASPRWKSRAMAATGVASISWVGSSALWAWKRWPNFWGPTPTVALPIGAAASSVVILSRFLAARPGVDLR